MKQTSYPDKNCLDSIRRLDFDGKDAGSLRRITGPELMYLARENGWRAKLLGYRYSGDGTAEKNRVVGYAAIAFYSPAPETFGLSERRCLLGLARTALACVTTDCTPPQINPSELPSKLAETRACFVTLRKNGSLRGCVGHIVPREPLCHAVVENARNAALRDPRFSRVRADEVDRIGIEISVLTDPQPLRFSSPEELLGKLEPYADGVVLRIGSRLATFLPQVWEQIPNKTEFLSRLSEKAGCEPSAWKSSEAAVSVYRVEAFADE